MRAGLFLVVIWLMSCMGTAQAAPDWTGLWETHWPGGGTRLLLTQQGNHVTGHSPLYDETIDATVEGNMLNGGWTEGSTRGRFHFEMSADGRNFIGRFNGGDWWNGERSTRPDPAMLFGQNTPREAFMRFIMACNVARAGMEDGWATAANGLDFGDGSANLDRNERLDRARALFELIDLTTFHQYDIPSVVTTPSNEVTLHLEQLGSDAVLAVQMRRSESGAWLIVMPAPPDMLAMRKALLAIHGGHAPAADSFRLLHNPRDTLRAFLEGMGDWKRDGRALVVSTMDMSSVPELVRTEEQERLAGYLMRIITRVGVIGLQSVPNDGTSRAPYVFYNHPDGRVVIAPSGPGPNAPWQFTASTVANADRLYRSIETKLPANPVLDALYPRPGFLVVRDFIAQRAPWLLGRGDPLEYWKLGVTLVYWVVLFFTSRFIARGCARFLARWSGEPLDQKRSFVAAMMICLISLSILPMVPVVELGWRTRQYLVPVIGLSGSLALAIVVWNLLGALGLVLERWTSRTTATTDDIVIYLVLASLRLFTVLFTGLAVMHFLSIPTNNIVAGLGISGLALAFASRETLSNVFGAGILVSDRPFRRGDSIKTNDIEGKVEHVGLRSTRVRTPQDSIIVVPNGRLSDSIITNLGTRRFHLINTTLTVTHGASPDRLEGFVEALRIRINNDEAFMPDLTKVNLTDITESGVLVALSVGVKGSGSEERAARHALMLDVVRIATEYGVRLGAGMDDDAPVLDTPATATDLMPGAGMAGKAS